MIIETGSNIQVPNPVDQLKQKTEMVETKFVFFVENFQTITQNFVFLDFIVYYFNA